MSVVYGAIEIVIMLFIIALVFGVVQPAFDQTGAINHGIGGWASEAHDTVLQNRTFTVVMIAVALFAAFILPEFRREDNTQSYKRR